MPPLQPRGGRGGRATHGRRATSAVPAAAGGDAMTRASSKPGRAWRRHGLSYTPEYRVWQTMVHRCTSPTSPAYADYGGRGITVCERWLNSPQAFVDDMGPRPSPKHEIDRRDNDRGYSPDNCRWVLRKVNDRNRRSNRIIEFRGERMPLAAWAERTGIAPDTLKRRIDSGWDVERALSTSARRKAANGTARRQVGGRPPKISDDAVAELRRLAATGIRSAALAERFGISRGHVKKLVRGERRRVP